MDDKSTVNGDLDLGHRVGKTHQSLMSLVKVAQDGGIALYVVRNEWEIGDILRRVREADHDATISRSQMEARFASGGRLRLHYYSRPDQALGLCPNAVAFSGTIQLGRSFGTGWTELVESMTQPLSRGKPQS